MAKSYFAILGITPNATGDEIRSAFRCLAKEFHPDAYLGSGNRFREIQEAFTVLGDRRRRHKYEQNNSKALPTKLFRHTTYPEPEPIIPEVGPVDIETYPRLDRFTILAPLPVPGWQTSLI